MCFSVLVVLYLFYRFSPKITRNSAAAEIARVGGRYAVQGHTRSLMSVPLDSSYDKRNNARGVDDDSRSCILPKFGVIQSPFLRRWDDYSPPPYIWQRKCVELDLLAQQPASKSANTKLSLKCGLETFRLTIH